MNPEILRLHAQIERHHWWFAARRSIVAGLLNEVVPHRVGATVMDLGCGTGGNIASLPSSYCRIGVELDRDAVEFASSTYPEVQFICGSVFAPETWSFGDALDACLLMDVLEHLDEDEKAVEIATEALGPGGHLLVTVPADPELWSRHDVHHHHRRRYTADSLAALLDRPNLQQRLLSPFNSRLYPIVRSVRQIQQRLGKWGSKGVTGDLSMPPAPINSLLKRVFEGELGRLRACLLGRADAFRRGVSLIALYQKRS